MQGALNEWNMQDFSSVKQASCQVLHDARHGGVASSVPVRRAVPIPYPRAGKRNTT
jgi:hypothetical protein